MPKDTFFNLKDEKQQRILTAALQEIAASGYDKASVTRIVKDAGIATGSFYQYFEDLDDLFVYVSLEAGKLKTTYIRQGDGGDRSQQSGKLHPRLVSGRHALCAGAPGVSPLRPKRASDQGYAAVCQDDRGSRKKRTGRVAVPFPGGGDRKRRAARGHYAGTVLQASDQRQHHDHRIPDGPEPGRRA